MHCKIIFEGELTMTNKQFCEMILTDSIKSLIRNRATESGVYDPDRDSIEFSATDDGISVIVTKCDPISRVVFDFTVPDMGFSIRKE
jgi:hypothetical protein